MKRIVPILLLLLNSTSSMEKAPTLSSPEGTLNTIVTSDGKTVVIEEPVAKHLIPGFVLKDAMYEAGRSTFVLKTIDSATFKIIYDNVNYSSQLNTLSDHSDYLFELGKLLSHYKSSNNYFYTQSKDIQRLIRNWGVISGTIMPSTLTFKCARIRLIAIKGSDKSPKSFMIKRITHCKNLEELNLSKFSLRSVPREFMRLVNLKKLNLSYNKLATLPEDFSPLRALEHLYLNNNELTELPLSLFVLTNLKTLNVSSNQLTTLPPDIGKLDNLERLSLSSNKLTELPAQICQLIKLTKLSLGANKLTALPSEFSSLGNLEELWVNNNELEELPPSLSCLTKLKLLWLCNNKLNSIPEEFTSLKELERINLENNQLTDIPRNIRDIRELNVLLLGKNKFGKEIAKSLHEHFSDLKCLSL